MTRKQEKKREKRQQEKRERLEREKQQQLEADNHKIAVKDVRNYFRELNDTYDKYKDKYNNPNIIKY